MKKKVKSKFNFKKFILFIIIIIIISISIKLISDIKTKNIIILDNSYYSDDDIIYKANIEDYPKFLFLNKNKIKNKLLELDLIEDVEIYKKWNFILEIKVKEKHILYLSRSTNKYVLSDGTTIKNNNSQNTPVLINYIPEDIEKEFIKTFSKVNEDTLSIISEIEYSKTDYDSKRFLLYMNDGNEVYINTIKMENLNKYISIVSTLDNKKGILYLDNGNYFEIKEK